MQVSMAKSERIYNALSAMSVGSCSVKWDIVVWRVGGGFILGDVGVRKDGHIHNLEDATEQMEWMIRRRKEAK